MYTDVATQSHVHCISCPTFVVVVVVVVAITSCVEISTPHEPASATAAAVRACVLKMAGRSQTQTTYPHPLGHYPALLGACCPCPGASPRYWSKGHLGPIWKQARWRRLMIWHIDTVRRNESC